MAKELTSEVLTIVWEKGAEKPVLMSDGIPGGVLYRNHEIQFLKRVLASLEKQKADSEKNARERDQAQYYH